jgi:hypothetical protein
MSLSKSLSEYICAAFSGLYVHTFEPDEALREIGELCRRQDWRLAVWDLDRGLSLGNGAAEVSNSSLLATDPLAAIRSLSGLTNPDGASLLVLRNFHRFLGSAEVIQALEHQLAQGKVHRTFVVILAPVVQLPVELERLFVILPHGLPDRSQLRDIAVALANDEELPTGTELDQVLDAAAGLTRYEAEGAFSLSLVRHGRLEPSTLWELKTQSLMKSGLLSLYRGKNTFAELGGLNSLKAFCLRSLQSSQRQRPGLKPRGILLLGLPGSGKSAFCKALGNETGRPTLVLDVGALMGSLVGQSEERTRQALKIADAMAPCILMIDEVEKALSGVTNSGPSDSGVSSRMFGSLLSWLNDHESDVFVVCTANDVSRLPPEFTRAERFDGLFCLDLPSSEQRQQIWEMYAAQFELDVQQRLPDDAQWTGAEIRACCRLAALLDVPLAQAGLQVVPVAITAAEAVERLRTWAHGRCLSADRVGLYSRATDKPTRRRVQRDSSAN